MKKKFVSLLLSAVLLLSIVSVPALAVQPDAESTTPSDSADSSAVVSLPASSTDESTVSSAESQPVSEATAEEEDEQIVYVALGDSICAGVGMDDISYNSDGSSTLDMSPNFENYPEDCYVSVVAKTLGLDRQHAINLGLPSLTSGDLVELLRDGTMSGMNMLSGCYYQYPQMQEYIRKADVVTVQIGSNDAFVPCVVALGNATNWKSEQLAAVILSGTLRSKSDDSKDALSESLSKLKLTEEETNATWKLLTHDMAEICEETYPKVTENLRQVVEQIRELNPDAQIILIGCTNPVPVLPCWTKYFRNYNKYMKQLAAVYHVSYISIPFAKTDLDVHPTVSGHKYIARKIVKAIQSND